MRRSIHISLLPALWPVRSLSRQSLIFLQMSRYPVGSRPHSRTHLIEGYVMVGCVVEPPGDLVANNPAAASIGKSRGAHGVLGVLARRQTTFAVSERLAVLGVWIGPAGHDQADRLKSLCWEGASANARDGNTGG